MSIHESRGHIRRHHAIQLVKAIVASIGIATLTGIVAVAAQHTAPSGHEFSSFAPGGRMTHPGPSTTPVDAQTSGAATPAVSTAPTAAAPARDFDYFPDHYVNQATKIEEQPVTF